MSRRISNTFLESKRVACPTPEAASGGMYVLTGKLDRPFSPCLQIIFGLDINGFRPVFQGIRPGLSLSVVENHVVYFRFGSIK